MSSKPGLATATESRQPWFSSRALRWSLGAGLAVMVAIGLVLLFLLTQATNNRELYERNYARLFALNMVVAGLLLIVITWIAYRMLGRLRRGRFGSRLLLKLAATFALAGFAPGLLIYVVSYQFVTRSIESWFDVKVESALVAGLTLGRSTLDTLSAELSEKSKIAAEQLTQVSDASAGLTLESVREQLGASDVVLWSASGQALASSGESRFLLSPARPTAQQFRQARRQEALAWIEGLEEAVPESNIPPRIRVLLQVNNPVLGLLGETRYLYVTRVLPPGFVANALAVADAHREYQELALARHGLRRMYIGTLTLTLFLAIFGAVLLAVVLGNQIVRPLLLLADGVRQVAAGDLRPKPALQGKDELGGLTRSFALMTQQLADARQAVEKSMGQVDASRANLQTILDNLTSGVIVLDPQGRILSSNPGATRILRAPLAACEGLQLASVPGLEVFGDGVQHQFEAFLGERSQHGLDHWQQSFELGASAASAAAQQGGDHQTLVARGATLPGETRLLVFDDISEIVSAQRAEAWSEVARRLAHEIKNPLTPIQLSAERLERRLSGKVAEPEQLVLNKSVKTIVDQVEAMKRLVNEFRDYGRLPVADLKPLDLNTLVADVLQLYASEMTPVPVLAEFDPACPFILGDAQQLRQVVHNLLQNAQDASEARRGSDARITLKTQWVEASGRVRLVVRDQGTGFSEKILKRAFEPYVTTKVKGTGLGLAVVKKIADEHGSRVDISNRMADGQIVGAQVSLSFAIANPAST